MRHSIIAILSAVLAAVIFAPAALAQAPERGTASVALRNFVRDSYIFKFDDGVSRGRIPARAAAVVGQVGGTLGFVYTTAYRGFSAQMTSVAADNLFRNNDDIIGYSRDGIVSIDQSSRRPDHAGGGGDESAPPQTTPWGITRVGGAGDGTGKTAWIIDTGVDFDHPDLNVDTAKSANFVLRGKNSADDGNGHGTHVAGTIAALDNNRDVVGVAAGATVVAVRVLDNSGSGSYSGVIAGVDYVAANASAGDVANMSLGGPAYEPLDTAVKNAASIVGKTIHFAIAAGNSGSFAGNHTPARANGDNVYTISAINSNNNLASWSNWGNPPVDYAAPGVSILSTWKGGGLNTISGTSMAAPHVAGILLLGPVKSGGTVVAGDNDGTPDTIAHR
jgi:subtilisin family serine protease